MKKEFFLWLVTGALCIVGVTCFVVWRYKVATQGPNIILITLDSLRANNLGCYGYVRNTSPTIDGIAREGVIFNNFIVPSSHTAPSNASLITSTYPNVHQVKDWGYQFSPKITKTLPVILKEHGYETAFISDQLSMSDIRGFEKGFDVFNTIKSLTVTYPHRRVLDITDWAISWLKGHKHKKFFLWLYYLSPHGPYVPYPPYDKIFIHDKFYDSNNEKIPISDDYSSQSTVETIPRHVAVDDIRDVNYYISQYDGEIRRVNTGISRVLEELKKEHLDKNTVVIINSDHGEALGEHNRYFCHANSLYDELVRVPLIIKWDNKIPAGTKIDKQVRTIDLMPTILDLCKIKNSNMRGQSLLPLIRGETNTVSSVAYSEWASLVSARTEDWKLIYDRSNGQYELYDLKNDPGETNNVIDKEPDIFKTLRLDINKYLSDSEAEGKPVRSRVPADLKEELRSLGYAQ